MRMRNRFWGMLAVVACAALVACLALCGCSTDQSSGDADSSGEESEAAQAVELQVFAPDELSKAMEEAQALYMETHDVTFAEARYGSADALQDLAASGIAADVWVGSSKDGMDFLEDAEATLPETRFDMLKDQLLIVAAEDDEELSECTLEDIAAGGYVVALGDESLSCGAYARQALSSVGCYEEPDGSTGAAAPGIGGSFAGALEGAGTVVECASVSSVLEQVQDGVADLAIVCASDVYRLGGVKIVGTVPAGSYQGIVYPAAVAAGSEHAEEASAFLSWCASDPECLKVWQKWGLTAA